jgi:SOS response associated peptidase (SRAP)
MVLHDPLLLLAKHIAVEGRIRYRGQSPSNFKLIPYSSPVPAWPRNRSGFDVRLEAEVFFNRGEALEVATCNARAETVAKKPMFSDSFKRRRCLIPISGYYEWQDTRRKAAVLFHPPRWSGDDDCGGTVVRLDRQGHRGEFVVVHHDNRRSERFCWRSAGYPAGTRKLKALNFCGQC